MPQENRSLSLPSHYPHARFLLSVNRLDQLPQDTGAEVVFAGRSNAGKSSAINVITQRQGLARSSKTPGRTQLINLFELLPERRIADLPGYGYAKAPKALRQHWRFLVSGYLQLRNCLTGMFLIVDARRGLQAEEGELVEWAQSRGLAVRVLLSKSDKLSRYQGRQVLHETQARLAAVAQAQLFSSTSKYGAQEAREALEEMLVKNTPVERGAAPPG